MTGDAFGFIQGFLFEIWSLFTSWVIPGTNLTPAVFLLGISITWTAYRFLRQFASGFFSVSGDEK